MEDEEYDDFILQIVARLDEVCLDIIEKITMEHELLVLASMLDFKAKLVFEIYHNGNTELARQHRLNILMAELENDGLNEQQKKKLH